MLHPDDAATAGVVDGQPVVVRSAHGELTGVAKVDAVHPTAARCRCRTATRPPT